MPLTFYPSVDAPLKGTLHEKLEMLMEAAERFKAAILDDASNFSEKEETASEEEKRMVPREMKAAFNWDEAAKIMREIRELSEADPDSKSVKANLLMKLAEIYEVLRAAKMSKLEAVRLALVNEAKQLKGNLS